jgi:hypothetical protein
MTDIETKAREIVVASTAMTLTEQNDLEHNIAAALREARSQALEEAAGVADAWDDVVADRIRALKDTTP